MAIAINGTTGISGVDGSASTPALQGSDTNTGISFGTDEVAINTGGTERAKVDASGYLRLASGGIQFNGDTAAANALDDYEEGTFTPVLLSDATTTYTTQLGTYVKIGRMVHVDAFVAINNADTSDSGVTGIELPFSNGSGLTVAGVLVGNNGWDTNLGTSNIVGWLPNNNDELRFYKNSGQNLTLITVNDIGSSGEVNISVTYLTS